MRAPGFFERNLVALAAGVGHELDDWVRWLRGRWDHGVGGAAGTFVAAVWRMAAWPVRRVLWPLLRWVGRGGLRLIGGRRARLLRAHAFDAREAWRARQRAWAYAVQERFERVAGVGSGMGAGGAAAGAAIAPAPDLDVTDEDFEDHAEESPLLRSLLEETAEHDALEDTAGPETEHQGSRG